MPGASIQGMMEGPRVLGQRTSNQVVVFDKLADAKQYYLHDQYLNYDTFLVC